MSSFLSSCERRPDARGPELGSSVQLVQGQVQEAQKGRQEREQQGGEREGRRRRRKHAALAPPPVPAAAQPLRPPHVAPSPPASAPGLGHDGRPPALGKRQHTQDCSHEPQRGTCCPPLFF